MMTEKTGESVCMTIYAILVQSIAAGSGLMGRLDLRGVHGAAVLRTLQDRKPLKIHMGAH